jgi:ABC-type transport system involved in cytochrome bd biosynthesis fused ATPase/permease subunit
MLLRVVNRMQRLLASEETQPQSQLERAPPGGVALRMQGTFAWAPESAPVLSNVDFTARTGDLVVVVGATGSGKSTLLAALLGLTHAAEGQRVEARGKVAYVAQQAYIFSGASLACRGKLPSRQTHGAATGRGSETQYKTTTRSRCSVQVQAQRHCTCMSCAITIHQTGPQTEHDCLAAAGTVRDNIVFDMEWSRERYARALDAAQLHADLAQMPAGDGTELGEGVRSLRPLVGFDVVHLALGCGGAC